MGKERPVDQKLLSYLPYVVKQGKEMTKAEVKALI